MRQLRYAAYGSNLHPERLAARVASARLLGTAFVADHSLRFHKRGRDGSGKCNIAQDGAGVHVAIFEFGAHEKPLLDRHEHAGIGYRDCRIAVPGFGECLTYRANDSHIDDSLVPWCWYHEMVLAGGKHHGFPASYLQQIETVIPLRDPDTGRRRQNRGVLDKMAPASTAARHDGTTKRA